MPFCSTLGKPSLSDAIYKAPLDWIAANTIGTAYDAALVEIYKAIEYNNRSLFERLNFLWTPDYTKEQTDSVINAYISILIKDKSLPDYDGRKADSSEMKNLISIIAKGSGQTEALTKLCLNQLYWGTKDGRIKTSTMLHPREKEKIEENTDTPENQPSWKDMFGFTKYIGPTLLVGAGVAALFFGSKIVKNVKEISND